MISHVNGFKLETTINEGLPHVRVSLGDGTVVVATDQVSVAGLRDLSAVFETAAKMALRQMERYYDELSRRLPRARN